MVSGFSRPPGRSSESLRESVSKALRFFASSSPKSKASSAAVGRAAVSTGGDESDLAWERFALPVFLSSAGEEEKKRTLFRRGRGQKGMRYLLSSCQSG